MPSALAVTHLDYLWVLWRALLPSNTFPAFVLCVLLANLTPLRRGRPFCLHVGVLPCLRLPDRPSSSAEAPLPRFCMLALRPCAVFCESAFLQTKQSYAVKTHS